MRRPSSRPAALSVLTVALAIAAALAVPAGAARERSTRGTPTIQGEDLVVADVDRRQGRRSPTGGQRAAVDRLDAEVRWNDFGTPQSLLIDDGGSGGGGAVVAARAFLSRNAALFGLSEEEVADLAVLGVNPIGQGHAVLLEQRFEGLSPGRDGLVTLAVRDGQVLYASSSLSANGSLADGPAISPAQAFASAARSAGVDTEARDVDVVSREDGWTELEVAGFDDRQHLRLAAVPTYTGPARPAYQAIVADPEHGLGSSVFIDAVTGEVLLRESLIDHATDDPTWDVFPSYPPLDYSTSDTREVWCQFGTAPGCVYAFDNPASPAGWDTNAVTGTPTLQTRGNNARATEKWSSPTPGGSDQGTAYSSSPTRDFLYPWTNQWFEDQCDPAVFTTPAANDIDAARANLHASHNRMHDWAYVLGFTETTWNSQEHNFGKGEDEADPEHGNAQAGGISGGFPTFSGRDNANQFTPPDGQDPVTNMFLWQPIPAAFYSPCVDGDYDMSVIAHEYTHMISNRMVAGPDQRLLGLQANAMGESWSDLAAVELLISSGDIPADQANPFAVGAYVTGDDVAGIRNYGMDRSPLNYSDVGYDFVCTTNAMGQCVIIGQVHADGEIWSAVNTDIRSAMIARYGGGTQAQQDACIAGDVPSTACPGNRRWIQLVFDAWLLMPSATTMLDARDAMLAADLTRFGGANQDLLWNAFARRGFGEHASSTGSDDVDPVPDFTSPYANEATVTFKPVGDGTGTVAELFVGHYEARVTPIADTDPATALDATFQIVPGAHDFVTRARGYGITRNALSFRAGQVRDLPVFLRHNLASSANGATASGDGVNHDKLIDDTEATNWAFLGADDAVENEAIGTEVTVRLDPSAPVHEFRRIQVSAQLRPRIHTDPADPGSQSRYSALRQFEIWVCTATASVDCTQDAQFTKIYTSASNAFPSVAPRPRVVDLTTRSFAVPRTTASHVRIRVLHNQCTGGPAYQGEQDADPRFQTDCGDGSTQDDVVRIAELQVFTQ
jgi:extracellular elastinolytic metalloproteinase